MGALIEGGNISTFFEVACPMQSEALSFGYTDAALFGQPG